MGDGLWIYIAEGMLALGIAVFIVWWTLPRQDKNENDGGREER